MRPISAMVWAELRLVRTGLFERIARLAPYHAIRAPSLVRFPDLFLELARAFPGDILKVYRKDLYLLAPSVFEEIGGHLSDFERARLDRYKTLMIGGGPIEVIEQRRLLASDSASAPSATS